MSKRRRLDADDAHNATHIAAHDAAHDITNIRRRTTQPFEIVYSDVSGIAPVPSSIGSCSYYVTFIDDFNRMAENT